MQHFLPQKETIQFLGQCLVFLLVIEHGNFQITKLFLQDQARLLTTVTGGGRTLSVGGFVSGAGRAVGFSGR